MDYEALYQQKLTTADEAVKVVKSGDWVDYGWPARWTRRSPDGWASWRISTCAAAS